jgi:hypothetical protein
LADVPNAVVRVGAVLIIKQVNEAGEPLVLVRELTSKEVRALELNPGIQKDPRSTLETLAIAVAGLEDDDETRGHDDRTVGEH